MEEGDKDWMMIRMVGGWVFLLVPAHPGSPGQRAVKRLLLLLWTVSLYLWHKFTCLYLTQWRNNSHFFTAQFLFVSYRRTFTRCTNQLYNVYENFLKITTSTRQMQRGKLTQYNVNKLIEALGQCIPPPRHVLPVSRYRSGSVSASVIRIASQI